MIENIDGGRGNCSFALGDWMHMVPSNKVGRRVGVEGAIVISSESNITWFLFAYGISLGDVHRQYFGFTKSKYTEFYFLYL